MLVTMAPGDDVLVAVEAHLLTVLGQDSGRAGVSFLGVDRVDVLRFGPDDDGLVRYVTLGMSRAPMSDPTATVADPTGPRAELLLSVHGLHDSVLRRLTVLATTSAVEGLIVAPGTSLTLGEPLWDGARFEAVLVAEAGAWRRGAAGTVAARWHRFARSQSADRATARAVLTRRPHCGSPAQRGAGSSGRRVVGTPRTGRDARCSSVGTTRSSRSVRPICTGRARR